MNITTDFSGKLTETISFNLFKNEKSDLKQKTHEQFRDTAIKYATTEGCEENISPDQLIFFFTNNAKHLTTAKDRDVDLGKAVVQLSERIKLAKSEEMKNSKSDIRKLVKNLEVFGTTRQVTIDESIGDIPLPTECFYAIFGHFDPEDRKQAGLVSKEWRSLVKDPLTTIHSINKYPEIPIQDYGFKTVEDLIKFAGNSGKVLTSLNLDGFEVTDDQLNQLVEAFPNINNLEIHSENLTDKGVSSLKELKELKALNLSTCYRITDIGIAHIGQLLNLQHLNLSFCRLITATGVGYIGKLANLQELNLTACTTTNDSLAELKNLIHLRVLDLAGSRAITGEGLAHLCNLTRIKILNLGFCINIIDQDLVHLERMSDLHALSMHHCKITGKGFSYLENLINLQYLDLESCEEITNEGCKFIGKLADLRVFCCTHSKITDEGLIHLRKLTLLEDLNLSHSNITGKGLVHLRDARNLQVLQLSYCLELKDISLGYIENFTNIKHLRLSGCYQITDKGFGFLGSLEKLRILNLDGLKIVPKALTYLENFIALKNIEHLTLQGTEITNKDLALLKKLTNLRHLDLGHCHMITGKGLVFLETLTNLEHLVLERSMVTYHGLAALVNKLDRLYFLDIDGCPITESQQQSLEEILSKR